MCATDDMTGWSPCDEILTCAWDRIQRITIGLKWVAASDNLPIRIFVLWESSLRSNYIISLFGSRPNLGKVEKQKSGVGAAQRVFFSPSSSVNFQPCASCPTELPKTIHFHRSSPSPPSSSSAPIWILFRGKRMNESNVPVYNRCDRKSMFI